MKHNSHSVLRLWCHLSRVTQIFIFLLILSLFPLILLYIHESQDFSNETRIEEFLYEINSKGRNSSDAECAALSNQTQAAYPYCLTKLAWMKHGWKTHQCYRSYGADSSICSHREYLSKVEKYCPPMTPRREKFMKIMEPIQDYAKINLNINELFSKMFDIPSNYIYIKKRIERMWPQWKVAAETNRLKHPDVMEKRKKLNILIHMGFLAEKKLNFAKKSNEGGPLGEMLQWSDLIASLHILGHNLYISTDKQTLQKAVKEAENATPCPPLDGNDKRIYLIVTDIIGIRGLRRHRAYLANNKCRIRLVDSFGTHVEFTDKVYFGMHKKELSGSIEKNPWGGLGLNSAQQHWTFFPHSDDNTFLGFAVDQPLEPIRPMFDRQSRKAVLVYGKEQYMWTGIEDAIATVKEVAEVHATVADADMSLAVFKNVTNHGLLDTTWLYSLLRSVKVFLGIGFPLEGPAPFEAISQGAVYINAKFNPPKSRLNYTFLAEKPTLREFASQLPYAERIGRPNVITVDIHDREELKKAIEEAISLNSDPFVPKELSTEGMLLRLALIVEKQDFCEPDRTAWPPAEELKETISDPGQSCEEACDRLKMVCEPMFFRLIDSTEILQRHFPICNSLTINSSSSVLAPFNCSLQEKPSLYSCASKERNSLPTIRRLCPCRSYYGSDRAICRSCLRV